MNDCLGPVTYRGQPQFARKSSFQFQKLILPAVIALATLGSMGLLVIGILLGRQFLPKESTLSNLSSAISGNLLGSDTRSSIEAEHLRLRSHVQTIGSSIAVDDQSEASAKRLRAEIPKFRALFLRACRLPTESKSIREFVAARAESRAMLERLRSQNPLGSSEEKVAPFWSVNTNTPAHELVTHARNEVTLASAEVASTLAVHVDFPDPMTYAGPEYEWSEEDRQVLAFIHLQGCMQRDTLRALAAIDIRAPAQRDLANVHATIDRYVELAKVVRKHPRKTSSMIAFVPKDNPYESLQRAASISIKELRKLMEAETKLSREVDFLFKEVDAFSDVCEGHLFGFQGQLPAMLGSNTTSSDRLKEFLAMEEKKMEDARKAEAERQEKERLKLAEESVRRQESEKRQREQEEERNRALAERLANPTSGLSGGRSGARGFEGQRENVGPGPGALGMPTGPRGNMAQPSFQQDFSGFANRPLGMPEDRFQPPAANRGDPAKMVTIAASKVKNGNTKDYIKDLPNWLLQYSPVVSISNGELKITLKDFDKPLSELEPCIPMLVFEEIDNNRRTIIAKEK